MTDLEYFVRLARLADEGVHRAEEGKRTTGVRANIEIFVRAGSSEESGFSRLARRMMSHTVAALAWGGYAMAAALAVLAITVGVECSVGAMAPGAWVAYLLAAVLSLLMGVTAHAVHDEI